MPEIFNQNELAEWCVLSTDRIRQLAAQGIFKKEGRGQYDAKACVQAYIVQIRDNNKRTTNNGSAKERRLEAQAEREELALAKEKGELIDRDDAVIFWRDSIARISQKLSKLKGLTVAQKEAVFAAIREATNEPENGR
jgi:phage terminase Nu1 subunit (DNA packaging protein)